ncbi:MAG: nucleotidyltransferase domain-containing protein [Candidatus Nanoarchaeia archaeon]
MVDEKKSVEENLSKDYIPKNKLGNLPVSNEMNKKLKEEMDKTKKDVETYKKKIKEKYSYIQAIGIVPKQASSKIEEEYEIAKEDRDRKLTHVLTIIPEAKFKEIGKVRLEAINIAKEINPQLWIHMLTPVDIWNLCLDSKFDIVEAFSMSYPVLDDGLLGGLRVAEIHKTMVLRKFEKYVTSYGIYGSLLRGEATKDSDVDVAIIIDDTDVKRMPRLELKEKLRGIVYSYIQEASAMAGVKNILNVQVWLLTEFWEGVKDAVPVFFTFLRDGVPLYDRGTFLPWKALLKMGKIKPSPEAIDMFMSSGDKLEKNVDRRLLDIAIIDLYWGILTPSQGMLMLYGLAPPTPRETVKQMRDVFYNKEKLLEKKYIDIFENIVEFYKGYEHGKNKKISGTDLDKMIKDALDYIKRLKELRREIERRVKKQTANEIYNELMDMLKAMLNKKSEQAVLNEFEETLVKPGKLPRKYLDSLVFISKLKKKLARKKQLTSKERKDVDKARKASNELMSMLVEYNQRCDFLSMEKARFIIKSKEREDKKAEIFFLENVFLVEGDKISIINQKIKQSNIEELRKQLMKCKDKETAIDWQALEKVKEYFGNFELIY